MDPILLQEQEGVRGDAAAAMLVQHGPQVLQHSFLRHGRKKLGTPGKNTKTNGRFCEELGWLEIPHLRAGFLVKLKISVEFREESMVAVALKMLHGELPSKMKGSKWNEYSSTRGETDSN